jgi:hypothetical protein
VSFGLIISWKQPFAASIQYYHHLLIQFDSCSRSLDIPEDVRVSLLKMTPSSYLGLSEQLAME